jgi:hypothetical protein
LDSCATNSTQDSSMNQVALDLTKFSLNLHKI